MTNPRRTVGTLFVLASIAPLACAPQTTIGHEREARARDGKGDIVVAVVWPWATRKEILFAEGLEVALAEINGSGGVHGRQVRLLKEDDRESINEGLLVAQRLADNPDVVGVIGHLQSYVTIPAAAIYDQAGLLLIAPTSSSPELTNKGYRRVFRTTFLDEDIGRQMADFAAAHDYRRIAIYYTRNSYGRSLSSAFEERAAEIGIAVVQRASYDAGQLSGAASFEATLREWKQLEFDAIFLAGQVPEAGTLIAEARRNGIRAPILGSDAMGTQALIETGGASVEGTVVPVLFHRDDQRARVQSFVAAFETRFGHAPDVGAALAYDALTILATAMRTAPSPAPDEVAGSLRALRSWEGVTGEITFGANGDRDARRIIKTVVRNGRFEYLKEPALPSPRGLAAQRP